MILHKMNNNLIQNKLDFFFTYFTLYFTQNILLIYMINYDFTQLTIFSDNKENIVHSMSKEHTVKNVHRGQNYREGEMMEFVFNIQAYGEIRSTHKLDIPCKFSMLNNIIS